ncbi:MAG TPA: peptide deformylase [Candidatus Acidoferrales bacterium]|nr:peptide deformylase [Candidatus Acidoferrales bacterium]
MIHPIVKYGAPVLEQVAAPVTEFDAKLAKLVEDMFESMYAAHGVGLAAPQIGLPLQLAVIDITSGQDPKAKLVLANPKIIATEDKQKEEEGCLSLPGFHAVVRRPRRVTIRARDVSGKEYTRTGEDLLARALCHEIDHLHGKLFIAHLSMLKRDLIRRRIRKLARASEW